MRLLKLLLGALLFLGVLVAAASPLTPTRWYAERMLSMDAPADGVWGLVQDVERWPEWNPWVEGAAVRREGDRVVWSSETVGEGSLRLTQVVPGERLEFSLSLEDGRFEGKGAIFLQTAGERTRASWLAEGGPRDLSGRLYAPLLQMLMGQQLEEGLGALKTAAELGRAVTEENAQEGTDSASEAAKTPEAVEAEDAEESP